MEGLKGRQFLSPGQSAASARVKGDKIILFSPGLRAESARYRMKRSAGVPQAPTAR